MSIGAVSEGELIKPRISILIPCYNAANYIGAALDSVLAQAYGPLEIIVVNDGSKDASADVLSQYQACGVTVIHQSNQGQCAAANRALEASTGDLIKFFDADDIMGEGMLHQQVLCLQGRSDAVAMGQWERFSGDDPFSVQFTQRGMYRNSDPVDWLVGEWMHAQPMMQCALWLIPREILNRSGGWDERLSLINDFEFFTRVLLNTSQIIFSPGAQLYYRSGIKSSLSGSTSDAAVHSAFLSLMLGVRHLIDAEDSPRTRRASANILQNFEYTYYPFYSDLRARMHARIAELGGADIAPDGPPGFHRLRPIMGWRAARIVQLVAERLGMNRASRSNRMARVK